MTHNITIIQLIILYIMNNGRDQTLKPVENKWKPNSYLGRYNAAHVL